MCAYPNRWNLFEQQRLERFQGARNALTNSGERVLNADGVDIGMTDPGGLQEFADIDKDASLTNSTYGNVRTFEMTDGAKAQLRANLNGTAVWAAGAAATGAVG